MKAIFNSEITDWERIPLAGTNRGFRYGDGFFETIAVVHGIPRFLDKHLDRLRDGAEKLQFNIRDTLDPSRMEKNIQRLQHENVLHDHAKARLTIWRNSEGLYGPKGGNTHYLLTLERITFKKLALLKRAGISTEVVNYISPISRFKTLSAMKYVLAGMEKTTKDLDEIIILDYRGFVSETLSSNIFWKKDETYYTTPLQTGCIDGIMRNWLMAHLKQNGLGIEEKLVKTDALLESDHIFTSNAMGIAHIQNIGSKRFEVDPIAQKINESLF